MADAAVEFLLNNLKDLLIHHGQLIVNANSQVEELVSYLGHFRAILKETSKKRRKDERLKEMVKQIRDVVYEAEDLVDTFVTLQTAKIASTSKLRKLITNPANLHNIAKDVEVIISKVKRIRSDMSMFDFAQVTLADGEHEIQEAPVVRQKNIVGFEDEAEKLIGFLKEENEDDVISIIGMPGLGKTTLAGIIYRDPRIIYEFPTRIWIYVSQEFTSKNVFLTILKKFMTITDDMTRQTEQELAKMVADHLETGRFLIVMDDVWTTEDWNKLKIVLPTSNKMGKVLITSRHVEVGRSANRARDPHSLRFLTEDESWLLLRYEVFGKPEFPSEVECFGRLIVKKCNMLPLAIVVIGGILVKKNPVLEDVGSRKNTWKKISDNVNAHIVADDSKNSMEKIIALSYDKLPYHLRACFLYMGMFPEDFAIPALKVICMWIAEGFIQEKDGISLEETAESYMNELIDRNLLRIDKRGRDGKVKTFRIHDMLRDFCRAEAGNEKENFLQEVKINNEGSFVPLVTEQQKFRRLCIHSNIIEFVSSKPNGPHVRSFASFSSEEAIMPTGYNSFIPASFKLLRVLEIKPIRFGNIPKNLNQLVHLRYIAISFSFAILPQSFDKLWNLQSLIVDTTEHILEIKADIWKMKQLRHLKTNVSTTLPKTGKDSLEGAKIQTLGTLSPHCCTEDVFKRARFMKKLSIRGNLAMLMDIKNGSFDCLGNLSNLEKLKLRNDMFPNAPSTAKLGKLPPAYQFPQKLRSLTLVETLLDWSHMSVLGSLENLEVLKLKDRAFTGNIWEAVDGGFRKLEVLYIGQTDLVIWKASHQHFPRLKCLELRHCQSLQKVPIELAEISSFKMLNLYRTKSAAASGKEIWARKGELEEGKSFKLSIFPPHE